MVNDIYYARWWGLSSSKPIFFLTLHLALAEISVTILSVGKMLSKIINLPKCSNCSPNVYIKSPPPPPHPNHGELCRDYRCTPKGFCLVGLGKEPFMFYWQCYNRNNHWVHAFCCVRCHPGLSQPLAQRFGSQKPGAFMSDTQNTLGPSTWCKIKMGPKSPSVNTQCTKHPGWMLHLLPPCVK